MFKPACLAVLLVVLAISSCYADPTCGSVNIVNQGGFAARFKTKTGGKETDWSDTVTAGVSRGWGTDQLKAAGFKTGDSCWVAMDVSGGPTHESGDNFNFDENSNVGCQYSAYGGFLNPSFSGVSTFNGRKLRFL